ncbi:MAG: chemotaxis protein CheW [Treponema sp.]|nr:chemotaxis protein CheW [Treponema sp.]
MADNDTQIQLVTFQLGEEVYGVDIMGVKEIVRIQDIRAIPSAPYYVEGILNLRRQIIPIINLHKRFRLAQPEKTEGDSNEFDGGFIILNIDGNNIGIIIDRIARVVMVESSEIKPPPQMLTGIGSEYIRGVIKRDEGGYVIMLDVNRLFDPKELQKIIDFQ